MILEEILALLTCAGSPAVMLGIPGGLEGTVNRAKLPSFSNSLCDWMRKVIFITFLTYYWSLNISTYLNLNLIVVKVLNTVLYIQYYQNYQVKDKYVQHSEKKTAQIYFDIGYSAIDGGPKRSELSISVLQVYIFLLLRTERSWMYCLN